MASELVNNGEEWMVKTNLDTSSVDVGIYDDSTDAVSDADTLPLSTEPSNGNYARQTGEALSAAQLSGDWGVDTDTVVSFDVTNTTGDVDSYFVVESDVSAGELAFTGSLSQTYALGNLDTLEISAGGVAVTVD